MPAVELSSGKTSHFLAKESVGDFKKLEVEDPSFCFTFSYSLFWSSPVLGTDPNILSSASPFVSDSLSPTDTPYIADANADSDSNATHNVRSDLGPNMVV